MKIACIGGGPAGLYFAISMKLRDPSHQILLIERNRPDDTFGWGVVLSDEALANVDHNDPISARAIRDEFAYWDDVAVVKDGTRNVSSGHGFCGIGRMKLLQILQHRALELGVELRFETEAADYEEYMAEYDLVVASDGLRSKARVQFATVFEPQIDERLCHFIWLGTHQKFDDAFTFIFEKTKHGWVWAHAYQFSDDTATFIVECSKTTFEAFGFAGLTQKESIAICEEIFKDHLGGHDLMTNANHIRGSAWINFPRVLCNRWSHKNLVLMGDAAATAHFSIGSGSRLAFDSAIALADYIDQEADLPNAFTKYENDRRLEVLRLQSAARNSMEWFEQVERYLDLDPMQFSYALLTRSQRISHENLRLRDPQWLAEAEQWFQKQGNNTGSQRSPMFTPYQVRGLNLSNRIVVSPMAQYKAHNGCPTDWHLVHYGSLAKGGAGLVYVEMTCTSADGRITEGCPGLYAPEHVIAWSKVTDFVHQESSAKICLQLGHAGPKGSTQRGWETMDAPLTKGNWPLKAASPVAWSAANQVPLAMTEAMMIEVTNDFVRAAKMGLEAGFDMVELHCAHGYLLSSFITPLTNKREDQYGGSLENRLRFPLRVFAAIRGVLPADMPMSVRISAHDWVGVEGMDPTQAVAVAQAFKQAGADIIDVSSGQTSTQAQPVYGRMYQTPFADQIRHEANIPTMTVGNIFEADHANSILMAGRADLVCLARPHLANPYWTHHAAAQLGDEQQQWPLPYGPGKDQLHRLAQIEAQKALQASSEIGKV
ncbi:MAG: bifunctional salicylyl-CoA 5-hydroxylase/oxidoreductase [Oceanospirillaceae bacterium]|jgi:anthraniloyl-CoA monooxygenase|nr:bifunctional salicylyl-CoA 5-hydroxylase/oxidoreductase [Oceanospirillaceae bacterium]MBT6077230.1 bifunctional salicylyl-CoA 5-hydroxylase/oxidoreductase [Oceanospirillaceae bacterium]